MVAMMQSIVLLLVGFVLLIKGADFFVEGSSSVARALRIPSRSEERRVGKECRSRWSPYH